MFEQILDYISRTNLFNFIIFASIIAYLAIKLDVSSMLEKGKNEVKENIENSENAKTESETKLKTVEELVANIENEISDILKSSKDNAKLVGEKIITDANNSVVVLKENAEKLIENKTALLKNGIMKRASLASIEAAKDHIVSELNNNWDLHYKLIDESIEAVNMYKKEEV